MKRKETLTVHECIIRFRIQYQISKFSIRKRMLRSYSLKTFPIPKFYDCWPKFIFRVSNKLFTTFNRMPSPPANPGMFKRRKSRDCVLHCTSQNTLNLYVSRTCNLSTSSIRRYLKYSKIIREIIFYMPGPWISKITVRRLQSGISIGLLILSNGNAGG